MRLISEKEAGIHEVLEVRDGAFRTDFRPVPEAIFVYGREVKDFRTVDYDALSMLNVSATQEWSWKVEARDADLAAIQALLSREGRNAAARTVSQSR